MLRCYLMDPDTDVCQTEQPQISYSVDFTAEQSSAMGSPIPYSIGSGGYMLGSATAILLYLCLIWIWIYLFHNITLLITRV